MEDWVRNKIEQARTEGWKRLDLGNAGLTNLPVEVYGLVTLECLVLGALYYDDEKDKWVNSENHGPPNKITVIAEQIVQLPALTKLYLGGTQVKDVSALAQLPALKTLDLSNAQVEDVSALAQLPALTVLDLGGTQVKDVSALAQLPALTVLDLRSTQVKDVSALAQLPALTKLYLNNTQVKDVSALAQLPALTKLYLGDTQVEDVSALAQLPALTELHLSGTQVEDVSALAQLPALTVLSLSGTQVKDVGALAQLPALTVLSLSGTQVKDVGALAQLPALTVLDLSGTQVKDVSALAQLPALTKFYLSYTQVKDVSALAQLPALTELHLSGTQLYTFPRWVLDRPQLRELSLYDTPLTDIPRELLGTSGRENCLAAVRTHFADLAQGECVDRDLKVILLGNGRVGKTSLVKRLVADDFDPREISTHAIQMTTWEPPWEDITPHLSIWDFGGQDIYHGTHALFLRSRAVFVIVWDRDSEQQAGYRDGELFFEHFPFSYWWDYVREASPESPVIIVENKCDTGVGSGVSIPTTYPCFPFSAKTGDGRETLLGALRNACMRELASLGTRTIGRGRWQVKQILLEYLQQDETRSPDDKRYRTISYEHFHKMCEQQHGQVSSPQELLRYLHHTGVVYYQEGLFHNQIILDQRWAIEAIYTIFHREKSYRQLKRRKGRFRPSDLHDLVWGEQFTAAEQRLFLSFMESCALCFRLDGWGTDDPEYIAPDLLPGGQEYADEIEARGERHGAEVVYYRYLHPFLHQRVMHRFMVDVGRLFRDRALYWHGGLCIEPPRVQALAIVTCQRGVDDKPAWGSITVEVRGRQRQSLLIRIRNAFAQLAPNHEQITQALSLDGHNWFNVTDIQSARDIGKVRSQQGTVLDTQLLLPYLIIEPEASLRDETPYTEEYHTMTQPAIFISYAWGDAHESGTSREDIVDQLYDALSAAGYRLKRDKMDLGYKGLISEFMQEIGRGDCIVVVISDKYLKSPLCMYELWEIYRNSQLNTSQFLERIIPIVLPDTKLYDFADRLEYVVYWEEQLERIEKLLDRVKRERISAAGSYKEYEKRRTVAQHIDTLLTFIADINTQIPQMIAAEDFATLKQAIEARVQQLR